MQEEVYHPEILCDKEYIEMKIKYSILFCWLKSYQTFMFVLHYVCGH